MDMDMDVAKGMKEEDLKKYMFPNYPIEPWYMELLLCKQLDATCKLDNPPPCVAPPYDPKHDRMFEVTSNLAESLVYECLRLKGKKDRMNADEIKPGQAVDLESLFFPRQIDYLIRRKGRGKIKAENLKGKYILVCCSYVPMVWRCPLRNAVYACSEIHSKLKGNFEMVVVTKMRHGWTQSRAKEKEAFRELFSAFPSPCLAVPFHARSLRHRIFTSLGVGFNPNILLIGPDGHALLHCSLMSFPIELVPKNVIGSDPTPFPFISRNYSSLWPCLPLPECRWIVNSPSSLKCLLSPSSDSLFRKEYGSSEHEPFVKKEVSLSYLNSKPVALYLFSTGEKLPLLRHIVEGCGQTNKELEVVVFCLLISHDLPSYPEMFSQVLAARRLSWWVAPPNLSASVVLKNMFEFQGDRVIIIGTNEQYVDVCGLQLMEIYGIYAYPFSFGSVVWETVEELSQVTVDSFKKLLQIPEYSSTANKVLFYFEVPYNVSPTVHDQYRRFNEYQGVEIRPISLVDNESLGIHAKKLLCQSESEYHKPTDLTLEYSWHTKGADKAKDFFLRFFNHEFPTIVTFGEDGRICSLLAHNHLPPSAPGLEPEHVFKGNRNLCGEVSSILEKYLTDYDAKEYAFDGSFEHGVEYMQKLRQTKFW